MAPHPHGVSEKRQGIKTKVVVALALVASVSCASAHSPTDSLDSWAVSPRTQALIKATDTFPPVPDCRDCPPLPPADVQAEQIRLIGAFSHIIELAAQDPPPPNGDASFTRDWQDYWTQVQQVVEAIAALDRSQGSLARANYHASETRILTDIARLSRTHPALSHIKKIFSDL